MIRLIKNIFFFYRDGFAGMKLGKRLWILVIIKLILLFTLVKYFFPDILQEEFSSDAERSDYILKQLTQGEK